MWSSDSCTMLHPTMPRDWIHSSGLSASVGCEASPFPKGPQPAELQAQRSPDLDKAHTSLHWVASLEGKNYKQDWRGLCPQHRYPEVHPGISSCCQNTARLPQHHLQVRNMAFLNSSPLHFWKKQGGKIATVQQNWKSLLCLLRLSHSR